MTRRTAIQDLTPADWALHHRELQLLRAHLFRDHTPQSLHVVGEPRPIAPSVVVTWYPEPPRRALLKGGVRYQLHFLGADGAAQISVEHWNEDRYSLHASYTTHSGATYTRFSLTRTFDELPECFVGCIKTMEQECALHLSWSQPRR
jgi:hypothetical protein